MYIFANKYEIVFNAFHRAVLTTRHVSLFFLNVSFLYDNVDTCICNFKKAFFFLTIVTSPVSASIVIGEGKVDKFRR